MSSPCTKDATASGGVTFMRAVSFLMPSSCFIACLLFAWKKQKGVDGEAKVAGDAPTSKRAAIS